MLVIVVCVYCGDTAKTFLKTPYTVLNEPSEQHGFRQERSSCGVVGPASGEDRVDPGAPA